MRNVPSVCSDKSSVLILCSLEWLPMQFVLKCDQWFYDDLYFSIHYLLLLGRTFGWALSPAHVRFSLLSIYLERSLNLQTCVPFDLVIWFDLIYQFLRKIATHFPYFHLLTPPPKWSIKDFYIFDLPLLITTPLSAHPTPF